MLTKKNILKIDAKFAMLVLHTSRKMEEKMSVDEFILFCKQLSLTEHLPNDVASYQGIFSYFKNAGIWSYENYHLLETIIENFVPEISESMQEYQKDYEGFKVATQLKHYIDALVELPRVKPDPALFARLETKIEVRISDRSLQYIDQLWKSLSHHFCLKSYELVLENMTPGSLTITWCFPRHETSQVKAMATSSSEFFSKHNIVEVSIDSQLIFQAEKTSHTEVYVLFVHL